MFSLGFCGILYPIFILRCCLKNNQFHLSTYIKGEENLTIQQLHMTLRDHEEYFKQFVCLVWMCSDIQPYRCFQIKPNKPIFLELRRTALSYETDCQVLMHSYIYPRTLMLIFLHQIS